MFFYIEVKHTWKYAHLKSKTSLNFIQKLASYRVVSTLCFCYKNHPGHLNCV